MDWSDTSWIDPALKVFNSQAELVAFNDDGLPRVSTDCDLLTRLSADGTYYAQVSSFCVASGGTNCPTKMNTGYSIFRHELFGTLPYIYETEPNEDPATIEPTTFDVDSQGGWLWTTELATFSSEQDVDFYRFVLPSVTPPDIFAESFLLALVFPSAGPNGNGSTASVGDVKVWRTIDSQQILFSAANAQELLAFPYASGRFGARFAVRVFPGEEILAEVHRMPGSGANDFYTLVFDPDTIYESEAEKAGEHTNDTLGTATPLVNPQPQGAGNNIYTIYGELPDTDIDVFRVEISPANPILKTRCEAEVRGSGVRGFTFDLMRPDGSTLLSDIPLEDNAEGASRNIIIPPDLGTELYLSVRANSLPAQGIPWYRCLLLSTPQ